MPVPPLKLVAGEESAYTRHVFEAILAGMHGDDDSKSQYDLRDDGARVKGVDTAETLAWHPWCEVQTPGSPDPLGEPWLPFPFTPRQLAALMVDGWGYFIQEKYGAWQDGPDETELLSINQLAGKAKTALREAYAAFRHAAEMAPRLDRNLEVKAEELAQRYNQMRELAMARERLRDSGISDADYTARLARIDGALTGENQSMKNARTTADAAYSAWRRAVVQHLLLPIDEVAAELFDCPTLRSVPPERRAEALRQLQATGEFFDTAAGRAHWDLTVEIGDIESEIRYWQLLTPQNISEAGRRKDEIRDLSTRLGERTARLNSIEEAMDGNQIPIDAKKESAVERQRRRLRELRSLGGDWVKRDGKWGARDRQSGAFAKLVEKETSSGAKNHSTKSVRDDLAAAAEAEANEKRNGLLLKGLGT